MYDGHFRGPFQAEIQIILSVVVRWFVPIDLALPFIDLKIISFFFLTAYSKYQAKKFSNIIMFHFLYMQYLTQRCITVLTLIIL